MMLIRSLFSAAVLLFAASSQAAYGNYNSVLLGARAAGMAGAFTALSGDPAASPFYNPATTVLMEGDHFSASATVYNKYDMQLGESRDFVEAPQRANRGFFRSLPSSGGSVLHFGSFAVGLNILVPDYDFHAGQIKGTGETVAFMNRVDESLWAGPTFSMRVTDVDSAGVSLYYTSRNYNRTVNDRLISTGSAVITNEEKTLTANSFVPVFGYHRRLSPTWSTGISYRPPSLPISGEGAYYRSKTETAPYTNAVINRGSLRAISQIPAKLALGVAREIKGKSTLSLDFQFYEGLSYDDMPEAPEGADHVEYRNVMNFAVGYEQVIREWFIFRFGVFSNRSAHPSPDASRGVRQGDEVDMNGFSSNFTLLTKHGTTFTLGGYYTGGEGHSVQLVGGSLALVSKSQQIFTMLVATGFAF